eukprot:6725642-Prymnesium_polylepis.1
MQAVHGAPRESMAKADALLAVALRADQPLDLLVLPELPFTGNVWESRDEVRAASQAVMARKL